MKTVYFDCSMGASAEMLAAALLEICPEQDKIIKCLNELELPGVTFMEEQAVRGGIKGTCMAIQVNSEMNVGNLEELFAFRLESLKLPQTVKNDIQAVYHLIDQAECAVGSRAEDSKRSYHFFDSEMAAAIAVCFLLHELALEWITASDIAVGSGLVQDVNGNFYPVPLPATAWILQGIPTYGGQISGECCTVAGAALLRYFVQKFGSQPRMCVKQIGYGFRDQKSTQKAAVTDTDEQEQRKNTLMRAMWGETEERRDSVLELSCNLDDMTPERIGFAMEELFQAGALDVYTTPIGMKKNRPAVLFTCMCRTEHREKMIELLFRHTTTLGIREHICNRYILNRSIEKVETEYGSVRVKHVSGWGTEREKAEYDDLVRIAREHDLSLSQVDDLVKNARRQKDQG